MKTIAFLLLTLLSGCATAPYVHQSLPHRPAAQSWDQANLKLEDHGCPTAIYVAPGGNLIQCDAIVTQGMAGTTTFYPGGVPVGSQQLPNNKPKGFPTLESAAAAALSYIAIKPTSFYYEWGGQLARDKSSGEFFFAPPNTSMHGDHVHIDDGDLPDGMEFMGTYHTHPCLPDHAIAYFSPGDLQEGIFEHTAVFMGDLCTGKVHEFLPGDKPDVEYVAAVNMWLTKGRVLGSFTDPRQKLVVK